MATKIEKKSIIRDHIIDSADVYSQKLAGKTFLYVYGDSYFEVSMRVTSRNLEVCCNASFERIRMDV